MVQINEKNLSTWISANSGDKPNKAALQMARSLSCKPEFLGVNMWLTPSTTKEGVTYYQQVYFAKFSTDYSHGMKLHIDCDCPSNIECIHALKIQRVYDSNWTYLYILFGFDDTRRFGDLWKRAQAVASMMTDDLYVNPSAYEEYDSEEVIAACGCVCNRTDRTTVQYCEAHEADYLYRQDIALQALQAAA